jgi:hypothetical protein
MIARLKCREAAKLASQRMDRELSFAERVSLRVHLAICDGCTNFTRQIAFLRRAVERIGSEAE